MAIGRIAEWIKQRKLRKIWRNPPQIPVYLDGQRQYVSESARRAAAANMAADPDVKARIEAMLGAEEARRRYPDAYV